MSRANAVAVTVETQKGVSRYLGQKRKLLATMLPRHLNVEHVLQMAMTACQRNHVLFSCDHESIWHATRDAAILGLEIGVMGSAYLVPFKGKATLIIGYQGLIDLCRRSGHIDSIETHVVYQNDEFELEYGRAQPLKHRPCLDGDPGDFKLVYAMAWFRDGGKQIEVMSLAQVNKVRNESMGGSGIPWTKHFDEMARKTAVRRLCKYLPKSVELAKAVAWEEEGISPITNSMDPDSFTEVLAKDVTGGTDSLVEEQEKKPRRRRGPGRPKKEPAAPPPSPEDEMPPPDDNGDIGQGDVFDPPPSMDEIDQEPSGRGASSSNGGPCEDFDFLVNQNRTEGGAQAVRQAIRDAQRSHPTVVGDDVHSLAQLDEGDKRLCAIVRGAFGAVMATSE